MKPETDLEMLRVRLSQLPTESPPASVWLSLQIAHAEQFPRRRSQRWRVAIAASLLLATVPALLWWRAPMPVEQQVQKSPAPVVANATAMPALDDRNEALRALDRYLQLRYQGGASDAELAPLWRQREELLRQPAVETQPQPIRI